jgi:hypothetical protein
MRKFFTFVAAMFAALALNAAPLSVADAIAEGMKLDSAATSEAEYEIQGFVINAQPFSLSYNNQIWFMADAADAKASDFQAYGCVAVEEKDTLQVINGDKVILKGKLFKYWNRNESKYIIEVKEGVASFVSKAEGDHSINKKTEAINVAKALEIGAALELKGVTAEAYEITGYVSAMAGKDTDFDNYGNQTYWIADSKESTAASNAEGAFEVYRGVAAEEVHVGDKVMVKTAIKRYDDGSEAGLIESETKAPVTILEKGSGSEEQDDADVVFVMVDFKDQGTSSTGSEVKATKDGVTFWCDKAWGDGQYGVRCYKGGKIKISSEGEQIGKLVFEFGLEKTGGLDETVVVNAKEWNYELPEQARFNKIKVYLGTAEEPEEPELPEGVITCAAAVELAASIDDPTEPKATVEGDAVKIRGYVTFAYDAKDGKQSAWLSDKKGSKSGVLQGAYLEITDAVVVGDYVEIEGTLAKYLKEGKDGKENEVIIEVINGKMAKVAQGIENAVLTEKAQKVVVDGVVYIIRDNKMYNLMGAQVR